MAHLITFNGVTLADTAGGQGSVVNFPKFPRAMSTPSTVYNSNARDTPIFVTDGENSTTFTGAYQILTGGLTEYDLIKDKESTVGTLVRDSESLTAVLLQSVSDPALRSGVVTCTLTFVLGAV